MDLNDIRSAITVLSFLLFIGIMVWTWAGRRREGFEEAAHLPFIENDGERRSPARPPEGAHTAVQGTEVTQ